MLCRPKAAVNCKAKAASSRSTETAASVPSTEMARASLAPTVCRGSGGVAVVADAAAVAVAMVRVQRPARTRQFDPNRQNGGGEHRPQIDARPPRVDAPAPFEPSGNFIRRDTFEDEIDTTPTLDTRPSFEAPRRIDLPETSLPDEIDTTPQPIERLSELRSEQPAEPAPPASKPEPEVEDPNRPKRSGWWQRKSFF